jgi:alpha-beta hydrolase superfamily lysophospholipase
MESDATRDGIATYRAAPSGPCVATLLFAHGYAESASRHEATFTYLASHGIAVETFDLPGHGASAGTRGFVRRFDDVVAFMRGERERLRALRPGTPLFAGGYSLGGLLAVRSAQADPDGLAGVVLVAPGLGVARSVPPLMRRIGVAFGDVAPHVPVARLSVRALRPDEPLVTAASNRMGRDPLIPARTAAESIRASAAAFSEAASWRVPALIVHGERDAVVPLSGPRRFAQRTGRDDVTLHVVPNGHHDLLTGPAGDAVRAEIAAWIRARSR